MCNKWKGRISLVTTHAGVQPYSYLINGTCFLSLRVNWSSVHHLRLQMAMETWIKSSYLKVAVPFLIVSLAWNWAAKCMEGEGAGLGMRLIIHGTECSVSESYTAL